MTSRFLLLVVLGQTALLLVTVTTLTAAHWLALRRDARGVRELEHGRDIVRRYLGHRLLEEEARARLESLESQTLARLLHEFAAHRMGEDRERTYLLLTGTSWYAGLAKMAQSRLWWRRLRAARAIATLAQPEHLLLVHEFLEDVAPAVRLAAAAALERLPSPGLAAAILERAITAHGPERNHLVEILAASDTLVLPVMTRRLSAPTDIETLRVLLKLTGRVGYTSLLPYVIPHVSASSTEVRIATATCLRNFPHPQTSNALRRLLTDRAWEVRARAAASLGTIGAVETTPDLTLAMRDTNWWVRLRAAIALRLVGAVGVEALSSIDPSTDRFASDMARYVLGLDDGAMAEYVGGATIDYSSASTPAMAS